MRGDAALRNNRPISRDLRRQAFGCRQINAELGFQQQMQEHTTLGFNAVYAHDYGHVAGESDLFVMGALQHNW